MLKPSGYEHLLSDSARSRAVRLANGEAAWAKIDMPAIVRSMAGAKLAIVGLEVWGVAPDTDEGKRYFRRPSNPLEFIQPLGPSVDGRLIWGELPTKDGQETVLRMKGHNHPEPGEAWDDFVRGMADLALDIVSESERRVVPGITDKLFFELDAIGPGGSS